ncbi:hypothetical protein [Hyperthermus butylicus]|uniref:Conserved crenarchaeal protein n=1 Tax=Hyperthermus butylicus (strain DSM 5456 / JCM 9403 / PLM1-5) TaxID=415426 RepID=A2BJJ0_HYPBU|nr:hypothetical protein [Hyperthermus butylicus]ABM80151.1 conserved crenarchaeal protein [Hyperthermus butylicus DSM 5456]
MRLGGWLESYRLLFLALLAITGVLGLASVGLEARVTSILSTSPENSFLTGSSSFYNELAARYPVQLGGPETIQPGWCTTYLLIGPDKPIKHGEAAWLAELYREGRVSMLIADETGNANPLLEVLGAGRIAGLVAAKPSTTPHPYMVLVNCNGTLIVSSKVARVEPGPGSVPVCWALTADGWVPIAVVYENNGSRLLVVGDSSIFANFLFNGYDGLPSTHSLAMSLVGMVARRGCTIVYDVAHYEYARLDVSALTFVVSRLLAVLPAALASKLSDLGGFAPLAAAAAVVVAALLALGSPVEPGAPPEPVGLRQIRENTRLILSELTGDAYGEPRGAQPPPQRRS